MNQATDDQALLKEAQRLLDSRASRLTNLRLTAEQVVRGEPGIVQILVRASRAVHTEEFVHVLAAVESELDIGDEQTVLLVPVVDEAA